MGGVCSVGKDNTLKLYVVWAKNTEVNKFTYEKRTLTVLARDGVKEDGEKYKTKEISGWFITGYTGSDELVVIPEVIAGSEVIGIAANAFSGSIERVVIPKTVHQIDGNAFTGCKSLREVVFFDSLQQVKNSSFPSSVQTVVLNAQRMAVYRGGEGDFAIKYQRARMLEGKKKLIVISGSSSLYGLNSELLEQTLNNEYNVVNYGTNAGVCMTFYMEAIMKYIGEGDIVIHAPEYTSSAQWGDNKIVWRHFRGNNQSYDIFREVDMRNFTDFWYAWCDYMTNAEGNPAVLRTPAKYQTGTNLNKYGDLTSYRKGPTYVASANGNIRTGILTSTRVKRLHNINDQLNEKGAIMLLSFGTCDVASINAKYTNQETYDMFTKYCADKLEYPVISNIGTYMMPHELMNNSTAHCSTAGALKRTQDLANDILNYFNGIYQ